MQVIKCYIGENGTHMSNYVNAVFMHLLLTVFTNGQSIWLAGNRPENINKIKVENVKISLLDMRGKKKKNNKQTKKKKKKKKKKNTKKQHHQCKTAYKL